MKKRLHLVLVLSLILCVALVGLQTTEEKKEDPLLKNLSVVDEIQPAPEEVKMGFESITGKDAVAHLKFLASDLLEGRDTASRGYDIAAQYAAAMFELWGLKPAGDTPRPQFRGFSSMAAGRKKMEQTYFQKMELKEVIKADGSAQVDWQKGRQRESITFYLNKDYTARVRSTQSLTAPVVFVGYGIREESLKFDEYKGLDVKGKIVMVLTEAPGKDDPDSPFNEKELRQKYYPSRFMRGMSSPKTRLAREMGAVAILQVENSPRAEGDVARRVLDARKVDDERAIIPGAEREMSLIQGKRRRMPWESLTRLRVSRQMADQILGFAGQDIENLKEKIASTLKPNSMVLEGVSLTIDNKVETKLVNSKNVLGYIEGSDPELKDEVVVIGAHLDHEGIRGDYIFNGADDNGSGSVGVLEVAEAFARNPEKPKRTVLFALWTGEEKGILGSRYYVTNPYFPLKKTVACINLDMISREFSERTLRMSARMMRLNFTSATMKKIELKKFAIGMMGANSPELAKIIRENNQYVGASVYLHKSRGGMAGGGSDHAAFSFHHIPYVFFNTALTEDYHRPSDTVDKVSPDLLQRVIRLAYLTTHTLANK